MAVLAPVRAIASAEHEKLLDTIDQIRSQGISRYIDLPQIIVCGDQSSGKSSCLEAICGLHFPTGDGLCTRFATEYILRRSPDSNIAISIVPDSDRPDHEKQGLLGFKTSTADLEKFPDIIEDAARAMGIGINGKTFAQDVLRVEISGPKQAHLTLVDLPGLFHSATTSHSDHDKDAVFSLVGSYIERSRSIILAVVSAKNDINNQAVLSFARKYDEKGARTLGIITKPDTLASGSPSELAYIDLAQNKNVTFALGWHVLRNRSWEERETTAEERDRTEDRFFDEGVWKSLGQASKGIKSMRLRLSKILHNHILGELPNLLDDVESSLTECKAQLLTLGDSRGTIDEQRVYLLKASQRFAALMTAAIDGVYNDGFFGSSLTDHGFQKRLCAVAMSILKDFAEAMRVGGHAIQLVDSLPSGYKHKKGTPRKVLKEKYYDEVQLRMRRNGGKELPGLYNPSIVGDLFFDQAHPWQRLLDDTIDKLLEATHTAVGLVLEASADEATLRGILGEVVNPGMEILELSLKSKAEEVLDPHKQGGRGEVLTLNHYFTDNIMAKREEKARKDMSKRLYDFLGKDPSLEPAENRRYEGHFDVRSLLNVLVKQSEPDMERFAAVDCVDAMMSYYQVALKSVIDNLSLYAVKTFFLNKTPELFTPASVYCLSDKQVQLIAGESDESLVEREMLVRKREILVQTRQILLRLDRHKTRDKSAKRKRTTSNDEDEQMVNGDGGDTHSGTW